MGGSFLEGPLFKGARGGSPTIFLIFFPPKVANLANLKCQKGSRIIGTAEHGVVSDSARGEKGLKKTHVTSLTIIKGKLQDCDTGCVAYFLQFLFMYSWCSSFSLSLLPVVMSQACQYQT